MSAQRSIHQDIVELKRSQLRRDSVAGLLIEPAASLNEFSDTLNAILSAHGLSVDSLSLLRLLYVVVRSEVEQKSNSESFALCIVPTYFKATDLTRSVLTSAVAAGEFTVSLGDLCVISINNKSMGFVFDSNSWNCVDSALSRLDVSYPSYFSQVFSYRSCPSCGFANQVGVSLTNCWKCKFPLPGEWAF